MRPRRDCPRGVRRMGIGGRGGFDQDCARRGRARRGDDGHRSRRAVDRRTAPFDGKGLAHVLAQSRRFRIADYAGVEVAGRNRRGSDRLAHAARAAGGAARQLRLRRRRAAAGRAHDPAHALARGPASPPRAGRLARLQGGLHPRRRGSRARSADRLDGCTGRALGCRYRRRAGGDAASAQGLAGFGGRPRAVDRNETRPS